jgi:anti-sigma regulatory factor (Ser/Thr protein kinase)
MVGHKQLPFDDSFMEKLKRIDSKSEIWFQEYRLDGTLREDKIWRDDIRSCLGELPDNILGIWLYGISEILNNAIDHSEGTILKVWIEKEETRISTLIQDDGVGVFKKIQRVFDLQDEYEVLLELTKGKLTTDSKRHSGEGIFFTSRMFDDFEISSGNNYFLRLKRLDENFISERNPIPNKRRMKMEGTDVHLCLNNNCTQTTEDVFRLYTTDTDNGFRFDKTIIPVRLVQFDDELLISRSQAKRLLRRFDCFRSVVLDFRDVCEIGQAFADEIFRVFHNEHPQIEITAINTNEQIERMMRRSGFAIKLQIK